MNKNPSPPRNDDNISTTGNLAPQGTKVRNLDVRESFSESQLNAIVVQPNPSKTGDAFERPPIERKNSVIVKSKIIWGSSESKIITTGIIPPLIIPRRKS